MGQLSGFPKAVIDLMVARQVQQGNIACATVFELNKISGKDGGGFDWEITPEKSLFWKKVIVHREFDFFFERYPHLRDKEEGPFPRSMYVWDNGESHSENSKPRLRLVLAKIGNKYLACSTHGSVKEVEEHLEKVCKQLSLFTWDKASDTMPQKDDSVELTMNEIAKKFNIDVSLLKIKR